MDLMYEKYTFANIMVRYISCTRYFTKKVFFCLYLKAHKVVAFKEVSAFCFDFSWELLE